MHKTIVATFCIRYGMLRIQGESDFVYVRPQESYNERVLMCTVKID